jgi:hypothetical protein
MGKACSTQECGEPGRVSHRLDGNEFFQGLFQSVTDFWPLIHISSTLICIRIDTISTKSRAHK